MWRYIAKRLLVALLTLLVISFVVALISYLAPDKPYNSLINHPNQSIADKARIIAAYGGDKPFIYQYWLFISKLTEPIWSWINWPLHVPSAPDLGESVFLHDSVAHAIWVRLPQTAILMGLAYIVQLLVAIPAGVVSAVKQYSRLDNTITAIAFLGLSIPNYWIGSLLIYFFALPHNGHNPLLPVGGTGDDLANIPLLAKHLVLPVIVLAIQGMAVYIRFIRSSMLEALGQDYIRTARAKGLPERTVIWRHAFRNSLLPLITLMGIDIPQLFGGAVITEFVFNWHGMGQLFVDSASHNDTATLLGLLMVLSFLVVMGNMIADIIYRAVDPRISYGKARI